MSTIRCPIAGLFCSSMKTFKKKSEMRFVLDIDAYSDKEILREKILNSFQQYDK
jgi:hypothetical protein